MMKESVLAYIHEHTVRKGLYQLGHIQTDPLYTIQDGYDELLLFSFVVGAAVRWRLHVFP